MLRYLTYGLILVIVLAAAAGFANAVDSRACSGYATYSQSAGDCVYINSYYNQQALQWRNTNPYASQYSNPYSKYTNWYDSNGNYHAYDTAPRDTGYTYNNQYYNGYAAYESVYGSRGYGTYGSGSANSGYGAYGSSGYSYGAISSSSGSGSGGNTYIRDSYNTNYYGDYNSNSYNSYGSGYGNGYSGYGSSGYNYGSGYGSGCSYGCGSYGYSPYTYYSYGYSQGSSPSVYYAFWSTH
jgi:hypothetical protein